MYPQARGLIKYLVADGRYDYIETGSLLSIKQNIKDIVIPSEEDSIEIDPLDFEEFLWAMDEKGLVDLIRLSFNKMKPLSKGPSFSLIHSPVLGGQATVALLELTVEETHVVVAGSARGIRY